MGRRYLWLKFGRNPPGKSKDILLIVHAGPESQQGHHKKDKKKITHVFTLIWKVNGVVRLPKKDKKKKLALLHSSIVHADPESQHVWRVAKKRTRKRQQLALLCWSGKSAPGMGHQKRTGKKQQLVLLYSSIVHADPESHQVRRVAKKKKGQEKDNNWHFYADPESQHGRQVAKKKRLVDDWHKSDKWS